MNEILRGSSNVNGVCPERVPFALLNEKQQQILQYKADGYTGLEIANMIGCISVKQVEYLTYSIGCIALNGVRRNYKNGYPRRARIAMVGLIQDGITNGYLSHDLQGAHVKPLTMRQAEIIELLLASGKTKSEMADHFVVELNTIRKHIENIHKKLGTRNLYHLAARATNLRMNDALRVIRRGKIVQ